MDVVETVVAGGRVEDDRVEAKRQWPSDHRRAARQIAGLANAAAGEPILWIVGLDEDEHQVRNPGDVEPSNWWNQVSSRFSDVPPDLTLLRVPMPHGPVAALWMETGRTPYVVTTDGAGGVDREVPWRRGTSLRSAHRSEILRSVIREAETPQLDLIAGWVRVTRSRPRTRDDDLGIDATPGGLEFVFSLTAYVEALEPVRFPQYRWSFEIATSQGTWSLPIDQISGPQTHAGSSSSGRPLYEPAGSIVYIPNSGLHINGSDSITLGGRTLLPDEAGELERAFSRAHRVDVSARFPIALTSRRAGLDAVLRRITRTKMRESPNSRFRYVDERLGEFSYGGGLPYEYRGPVETTEPAKD